MTSFMGFDIWIPSFQNIHCCDNTISEIALYYTFKQKIQPDRIVVHRADIDAPDCNPGGKCPEKRGKYTGCGIQCAGGQRGMIGASEGNLAGVGKLVDFRVWTEFSEISTEFVLEMRFLLLLHLWLLLFLTVTCGAEDFDGAAGLRRSAAADRECIFVKRLRFGRGKKGYYDIQLQ